jgi:uncharacterized membrane protein (Fun14 family)
MITTADIAPFAGTVGGGFFLGVLVGYALKKVIKLAAIIFGLFIAALAYLEYQKIVSVDWNRIQIVSKTELLGLLIQLYTSQVLLAQLTLYLILEFPLHLVLLLV